MTIQAALTFIHAVRNDGRLAERLRGLGADADLERVAEFAREEGFDVTASDLREAHARDWSMRRVRYGRSEEA